MAGRDDRHSMGRVVDGKLARAGSAGTGERLRDVDGQLRRAAELTRGSPGSCRTMRDAVALVIQGSSIARRGSVSRRSAGGYSGLAKHLRRDGCEVRTDGTLRGGKQAREQQQESAAVGLAQRAITQTHVPARAPSPTPACQSACQCCSLRRVGGRRPLVVTASSCNRHGMGPGAEVGNLSESARCPQSFRWAAQTVDRAPRLLPPHLFAAATLLSTHPSSTTVLPSLRLQRQSARCLCARITILHTLSFPKTAQSAFQLSSRAIYGPYTCRNLSIDLHHAIRPAAQSSCLSSQDGNFACSITFTINHAPSSFCVTAIRIHSFLASTVA